MKNEPIDTHTLYWKSTLLKVLQVGRSVYFFLFLFFSFFSLFLYVGTVVGHLSPYNNNGPQQKRLDSASVTGCFLYFRWSTMMSKWVALSPVGPAFSFYFSTFFTFFLPSFGTNWTCSIARRDWKQWHQALRYVGVIWSILFMFLQSTLYKCYTYKC